MKNKTLVIGASENPDRYSNRAIRSLLAHGHEILALGNKTGNVAGISISKEQIKYDDVDTVTLYLNPDNQKSYYNYILALEPRRIIFNPGTENRELAALATAKGILCKEACTLIMLSTGQY
jgi:predicted CoA-binding protein